MFRAGRDRLGGVTQRYAAFVRAINVGTANRIKMVDMAALFERAGCRDVTWHLQSGNMVFRVDDDLAADRESLTAGIEESLVAHGLKNAAVMVRSTDELDGLLARAPFVEYDNAEFFFSVSFLRRPPKATPTERLDREGVVVTYLDDLVVSAAIPRSAKLTGGMSTLIDKPWGTPTTTRWWNVVEAVAAKAVA